MSNVVRLKGDVLLPGRGHIGEVVSIHHDQAIANIRWYHNGVIIGPYHWECLELLAPLEALAAQAE